MTPATRPVEGACRLSLGLHGLPSVAFPKIFKGLCGFQRPSKPPEDFSASDEAEARGFLVAGGADDLPREVEATAGGHLEAVVCPQQAAQPVSRKVGADPLVWGSSRGRHTKTAGVDEVVLDVVRRLEDLGLLETADGAHELQLQRQEVVVMVVMMVVEVVWMERPSSHTCTASGKALEMPFG